MSNLTPRTSNGRPFVKGQVANPKGRPPGLPDRRTRYRELIEARMPELVETCVKLALQGDVQALRLCLERVLPALRPGDEPYAFAKDATEGPADQARAVIQAAMAGLILPSTASTLMSVIAGQVRAIEFDELDRRVGALESASEVVHGQSAGGPTP